MRFARIEFDKGRVQRARRFTVYRIAPPWPVNCNDPYATMITDFNTSGHGAHTALQPISRRQKPSGQSMASTAA